MMELNFLCKKKILKKLKYKIIFLLMCYGYENELVFPIYVSEKEFKNSIDLLLLINDDHSH